MPILLLAMLLPHQPVGSFGSYGLLSPVCRSLATAFEIWGHATDEGFFARTEAGMISEGAPDDPTRDPVYYDPTFEYLRAIGFEVI